MCSPRTPVLCSLISIIYFSAIYAVAITAPEILLPPNLYNSSSLSLTTLTDFPENDFSFDIAFGGVDLDRTSVLSNAVDALAMLAGRDFLGLEVGIHSHLARYPNAVVDVVPVSPAINFENRLAVWGIYRAVKFMISHSRFESARVDCTYKATILAQVYFERPGYPSPARSSMKTNGTALDLNTTITSTSVTTTEPLSHFQLNVVFHFFPHAETLGMMDVYITVMATLTRLAEWPGTDPVSPFRAGAGDGYNARMVFHSAETIRATPPFYEYKWIVETVRQIPGWMLAQGRFAELGIGIVVNQVHLGTAVLERGYAQSGVPGLVGGLKPNTDIEAS